MLLVAGIPLAGRYGWRSSGLHVPWRLRATKSSRLRHCPLSLTGFIL